MASVGAPYARDVKPMLPVSPASSGTMGNQQDVKVESPMDLAEAVEHGRSPSDGNADMDNDEAADGAAQGQAEAQGGNVRKRRRSRKGLDKRFECKAEGCGKSYSRAEHLYRHQLNHNSKAIYQCHVPDCSRTFVRGDLLKRHMDRHAAKGSQLNRRSSMVSHMGPVIGGSPTSPDYGRMGPDFAKGPPSTHLPYHSPQDASTAPFSPVSNTPTAGYPPTASTSGIGSYSHESMYGQPNPLHNQRHSSAGPSRPSVQTNISPYGVLSPASTQPTYHGHQTETPLNTPFVPQKNVMPFNLPPAQYPNAPDGLPHETSQSYSTSTPAEYAESAHPQTGEIMILDQMAMAASGPVFGNDGLNKSPYVGMPEDFMAYLFHTGTPSDGPGSPISQIMPSNYSNYGDLQNNQYSGPYFSNDGPVTGYFPAAPQQVMAVTNLLDQNEVPEAAISEEKSQEIFDFIKDRFSENEHAPVERQRDSILEGDRTQQDHMLSKRMMQAYIRSYWYHFSDQIPILHKPTFSPEKTPKLLLLAMMTIGAACLDRTHGPKVTKAGAKLSNFLAWHIRWELFMDRHSRPPAKLWIFQTFILLELYEKMYSTRELHERAHIHHATTITLMRRGRSLIGKTIADSPPNPRDSANGSRQSSTSGPSSHNPDDWWNMWVTNESTRRTAFAAFLVDSIHATMFGHSAVMVAHEMRLALPCDETLWKATSSGEVGRIEANLMSQGHKQVSFLEGLKRTLSNSEVRTDSFGRTVLMAGLLSVTWHMHQRDLQVNVLGGGVIQALGGRDKWRATLTRAYDTWKANFDSALEQRQNPADPYRWDAETSEFNIVFESRTVLHNLAHMAMHADIVDLQMFARAKRLLGRSIGQPEFSSAQRRIKDHWAPSARARDAAFYALSFLSSVLAPDEANASHLGGYHQGEAYGAHDDVLLNRSWVLYFAALVVWCYGFALEGPCVNAVKPSSHSEKLQQMRKYLLKFGSITDPNELKSMKGINNNTSLLMVLKDSFENSRWELLHEASNLLNNCIALNSGANLV